MKQAVICISWEGELSLMDFSIFTNRSLHLSSIGQLLQSQSWTIKKLYTPPPPTTTTYSLFKFQEGDSSKDKIKLSNLKLNTKAFILVLLRILWQIGDIRQHFWVFSLVHHRLGAPLTKPVYIMCIDNMLLCKGNLLILLNNISFDG